MAETKMTGAERVALVREAMDEAGHSYSCPASSHERGGCGSALAVCGDATCLHYRLSRLAAEMEAEQAGERKRKRKVPGHLCYYTVLHGNDRVTGLFTDKDEAREAADDIDGVVIALHHEDNCNVRD